MLVDIWEELAGLVGPSWIEAAVKSCPVRSGAAAGVVSSRSAGGVRARQARASAARRASGDADPARDELGVGALTRTRPRGAPPVVALAGHSELVSHEGDRVLFFLSLARDRRILHGCCFANQSATFLRNHVPSQNRVLLTEPLQPGSLVLAQLRHRPQPPQPSVEGGPLMYQMDVVAAASRFHYCRSVVFRLVTRGAPEGARTPNVLVRSQRQHPATTRNLSRSGLILGSRSEDVHVVRSR